MSNKRNSSRHLEQNYLFVRKVCLLMVYNYSHKRKMKIKLILKGVLLYVTAFAVILFIEGVDSIYDNGLFIQFIIACAALCYACYRLISEEELEILTFNKWFNKLEE